jgi:hypothetical protein
MARITSLGPVELVGPGVNNRFLIEVIHGRHDTILQILIDTEAQRRGNPGGRQSEGIGSDGSRPAAGNIDVK